jgi:hypothetical protein
MFTYLPVYRVLICVEHQHAVYGLDEHLKRHHGLPAARRKELRAAYAGLAIDAPAQLSLPAPNSAPIAELGRAQDAFFCCQQEKEEAGAGAAGAAAAVQQHRSCSYITTNRQEMRNIPPCVTEILVGRNERIRNSILRECLLYLRSYWLVPAHRVFRHTGRDVKHTNQQHSVKLTRWSSPATASYEEHAARLWQPVKVQTFFRERRYVRYFVVQAEEEEDEEDEEEQQEQEQQQGEQQQSDEQQESERQGDYKLRLSLLSSSLEAIKREDSEAINRMAEEASAKDRTGWFKRTRWDEHLQAYPDWKLLSSNA